MEPCDDSSPRWKIGPCFPHGSVGCCSSEFKAPHCIKVRACVAWLILHVILDLKRHHLKRKGLTFWLQRGPYSISKGAMANFRFSPPFVSRRWKMSSRLIHIGILGRRRLFFKAALFYLTHVFYCGTKCGRGGKSPFDNRFGLIGREIPRITWRSLLAQRRLARQLPFDSNWYLLVSSDEKKIAPKRLFAFAKLASYSDDDFSYTSCQFFCRSI